MKPSLSYDALRQVVTEQQEEAARLRESPFIERDKTEELREVLERSWIKVIMGIRRCGKSVMAHQALKGVPYGYLNFDDERLAGISAADLNKLLQFLLELCPDVKTLFFDEIQNVDGWELFVNRLQRQGYNLFITGSNSKLLSKELATHLTGRYIAIELMPFSFREYLRAKGHMWNAADLYKTQARAALYALLRQYLQEGGFPEMVVGGFHAGYLRELYDKIVSRDIIYRYHVKYTHALKEIAVYSHANLANRLTFHKIKNTFDISSVHTVKNYYQYLMDAYIVHLVRSFSFKHKEQIRQPKKVYTIDNGLSASISPKFTQDLGAALENLVFQELYRRKQDFSYYATPDCEVDFVLHNQRKVSSLVQVAWTLEESSTRKREINALLKAAKHLHCKSLAIITWEEEATETIDGLEIQILPLWKWLLQ